MAGVAAQLADDLAEQLEVLEVPARACVHMYVPALHMATPGCGDTGSARGSQPFTARAGRGDRKVKPLLDPCCLGPRASVESVLPNPMVSLSRPLHSPGHQGPE